MVGCISDSVIHHFHAADDGAKRRALSALRVPAVSITLWSVESNATKKLNVSWFKRLKEKQLLADSLRAAKLDMLASDQYYRYPYAWAGIVVFGDGK